MRNVFFELHFVTINKTVKDRNIAADSNVIATIQHGNETNNVQARSAARVCTAHVPPLI